MTAETRLAEMLRNRGLQLPPAPQPKGFYKPLVVEGNLVYTSGHLSMKVSGELVAGKLGADLDVNAGKEAAALAGLGILSTLRAALGNLDQVCRVVKVLGFINCTAEFDQQPAVLNGCSELLAEVFGPEAGVGARSAVGANSLPLGAAVEVEAVFEIT
jgi:enamine deaminase RidA (YjgF/YER057c/UK114 family)